jgi:hypothetical protein
MFRRHQNKYFIFGFPTLVSPKLYLLDTHYPLENLLGQIHRAMLLAQCALKAFPPTTRI